MSNPEIPQWLKTLPRAPVYRPTETEFADPIAFISRIEREAAAFGICKVIPPLPKPSKKFVLANLNRSLSNSPDLVPIPNPGESDGVFTTRHQELGTGRVRTPVHKRVWQSGEFYTLEQFEAKSKAFAKSQLGGFKEVTPMLVETLFWKAAAEKPIYIEYANDVPGSGFGVPEEPFRWFYSRRRKRKRAFGCQRIQETKCPRRVDRSLDSESRRESMGSAGWKLSNSPWNLQVIARSPGSITRFMPDEVPGVTSPMVYIGMLFSWFAWHVEDHELHSLNFLHMGAPKTWYAVPGDHAATLEEIIRVQGYGGNVDPLTSLAMLGEKTTLLSPEVLVASGLPCCRLVQNPGEFVVTFPRAYHVGFSHGFNCGEAANFATSQWLKFAKDAAVRRAAMDYLPMLSHQQLLYMLAISFISRIPRELLSGGRTSRSRDRNKEEREFLVKKAFLHDMMNENQLVCSLLDKKSIPNVVLWEPDLLPIPCTGPQPYSFPLPLEEAHERNDHSGTEMIQCKQKFNNSADSKMDDFRTEHALEGTNELTGTKSQSISVRTDIDACSAEYASSQVEKINCLDADEGDLPFGLSIDSGSLACVACGILGYPFMAILQPSEKALKELSPVNWEEIDEKIKNSQCLSQPQCLPSSKKKFDSDGLNFMKESSLSTAEAPDLVICQANKTTLDQTEALTTSSINSLPIDSCEGYGSNISLMKDQVGQMHYQNDNNEILSSKATVLDYSKGQKTCNKGEEVGEKNDVSSRVLSAMETCMKPDSVLCTEVEICHEEVTNWSTSKEFVRPRIFCLQHALEIEKLLQCKGGADVLIICHSDYLRIKALAISIAEEIGVQFDCKDIATENASPSDLHLINISIDDEEHEEDGKDWTSILGLNLKYCVKLRKQSSANQEQLALSLGGISFDPSPVSVVSNLKWLCRKPRTPYKVVGVSQSRSHMETNTKMVGAETRKRNTSHLKVYQTCKREQNALAASFCGSARGDLPIQLDCHSINQFDRDDQRGTSGLGYFHHEKFNDSNDNNLLNVPISIVESSQIHQDSWLRRGVNTSHGIINSLKFQDSPPHATRGNVSVKEHFEICSGIDRLIVPVPLNCESHQSYYNVPILSCLDIYEKITDGSSLNCKADVAESTESQEDTTELENELSLVQQNVEILDERNFGSEIPDLDSGQVNSLLVENQLVASTPSSNVLPEVLANEEPMTHEIAGDSSTLQIQFSHEGTMFNANTPCEVAFAKEFHVATLDEIQPSIVSGIGNSILVNNSAMEQERHIGNTIWVNAEASHSYNAEMRAVDSSVETTESGRLSAKTLGIQEPVARVGSIRRDADSCTSDIIGRSIGNSARIDIIHYVRRRSKGKHEADEKTDNSFSFNGFIRSPCEGLRPRTGRTSSLKNDTPTVVKQVTVQGIKRQDTSAVQRGKSNLKESLKCDLEGCSMSFRSRGELSMHKRNRCTVEGCGKRFSSHRSTVRHYCIHNDERPLKCPWKGCNTTFKWAWARTEHVRVHTGERPYKCKVAGCGQTFRYVSDFSRHRRKTGHYVNSSAS
ncbi:probable lysine-specific demethylase SE14 [Typha angustifolia]|uniref:probable lysine-specific demethylase SE14 n=1 Tax=Typha angustifolia TaxID=59011 RepID=UPI003C2E1FF0